MDSQSLNCDDQQNEVNQTKRAKTEYPPDFNFPQKRDLIVRSSIVQLKRNKNLLDKKVNSQNFASRNFFFHSILIDFF